MISVLSAVLKNMGPEITHEEDWLFKPELLYATFDDTGAKCDYPCLYAPCQQSEIQNEKF